MTLPWCETAKWGDEGVAILGTRAADGPRVLGVGRHDRRRLLGVWTEAFIACGTAISFVVAARSIRVDPLDRIGQVSALAALQFLFGMVAVVAVVAVFAVSVWTRTGRHAVTHDAISCSLLAGATSGFVAGGVQVALRGTAWGLNANRGDAGRFVEWAERLALGESIPGGYPPGFVWAVRMAADITALPPEYALKHVQIIGTALIGPICYLAWRQVLSPARALVVGVLAALPLIDPYKPFTGLILVILLAILARIAQDLRAVSHWSWQRVLLTSTALGSCLGFLALMYSGWFLWCLPGAIAVVTINLPWRSGSTALRKVLVYLGACALTLLLVAGSHLVGLLASSSGSDRYFYFDTAVDPAFVVMWRGDMPGRLGEWPPVGELGGVGLFVLVLAVGLAVAIATSWDDVVVQVAVTCLVAAWFLRFMFAAVMYETGVVNLWPRTAALILYCLLLTTFTAVMNACRDRDCTVSGSHFFAFSPESPRQFVGLLTGVALILGSSASSLTDNYMPRHDGSLAELAWRAHVDVLVNGRCPQTAPTNGCTDAHQ